MVVREEMSRIRRPSPAGGLRVVQPRLLTPRQFVELSPGERARVVRVEAVPPKIGETGFGRVRVFLSR